MIIEKINAIAKNALETGTTSRQKQQTADTDKQIEQLQDQLRKQEQEVYLLREKVRTLTSKVVGKK